MNQATIAPVRQTVTVPIPAQRAFDLFTEGFTSWWIGHHIGRAELDQVVIEPRVGGRWYERGTDGTECDWGKVLVFDPPGRLVMTWQLNAKFEYDADISHASEVEVRFAEEDGRTRVDLEHRHFERVADNGDELARAVADKGGWPTILDLYAKAAAR
jgi:uncharacterized protein YndB with AHSA1/START domain